MWGSLTGRVLTAESVMEFIMGQPTFQSYDDLTGVCWFTEFYWHDKVLYTSELKSLFLFKQSPYKFNTSSECSFGMNAVGSKWFDLIFFE